MSIIIIIPIRKYVSKWNQDEQEAVHVLYVLVIYWGRSNRTITIQS